MSSQTYRNPEGGLIDREQPFGFSFDGMGYQGYAGDTVASALLANGVHLAGRSFKYHRPRGIYTAGPEEPNALLELRNGARREPNTRATVAELYQGLEATSQNRWPSLKWDLMSIAGEASAFLPAGFYYKTFMWPKQFWEKLYEPAIRRAAGLGRAATLEDPDHYERCTLHCDVLVVGAGPAGLVAALSAARSGARVVLVEQDHRVGGSLLRSAVQLDGHEATRRVDQLRVDFLQCEQATLLNRTTVFGYYDHNILGAVERVCDHLAVPPAHQPRQRLWRIHAGRVVLATGAIERPLVFGNNDRPGIMLAGAVSTYVNRYAVRPGKRAVVFTNNSSAYQTVRDLTRAGISVVAVVDSRASVDPQQIAMTHDAGARHFGKAMVSNANGRLRLNGVDIVSGGGSEHIECDLLCVSGGWNPDVQLHSQTGVRPLWSARHAAFLPAEPRQAECSIGACKGQFDLAAALSQGVAAGVDAARQCGFKSAGQIAVPTVDRIEAPYHIEALWRVRAGRAKALVDFQNDVARTDIALSAREGYRSVEHMKRYTTLGMATDQGKLSGVNGLAILAEELGKPIEQVGTTTFRPPVVPVSMGILAGTSRGRLFQPTRYTPMHQWAVNRAAVFVEAGQWLRPRYYPKSGEGMMAASVRETLGVRSSVGLCDVSTLGKIDVQGRDVAEFLNRLYCNGWKTLPVGKARYGLMLREDGLVLDDGTTSRLSDQHYFMTTTTAEAAAVMGHMEYYHQAVWPELDVQYCSVTEQWAAMAIAGPNSRKVLQKLVTSLDISNEAFPFLAAAEFQLGGFTARLFRISFSGELAFELNVPAGYGESVWQALMEAGEEFDIVPYGTEALGIMRIEKGHVAGPEVNGQTSAADMGLGGMMSGKKDYIGRPMAARQAFLEEQRERLIGLRCVSKADRLYAGAHLVGIDDAAVIANDQGHITSITYSPMLDIWIGLGFIKGGTSRIGEKLRAVNPLQDHEAEVEVVSPHFFDPDNERLYV
ncbi:MAG: sarcosine oxidase subunit alpha family protein [Sulfitobacter sp.]|nr:sarcosine oxidase subunit alpha family protein [Sulfitobacter sp.]